MDGVRKDGSRSLIVPVIRDAAELPFNDFRDEYERLIERARTNALTADELQGATLTLTNPGGIGTVASVPRLMPGQGTIVAVGAIGYPAEWRGVPEPSIRDLGVGKVMTMTSTYDHRVIQGAESGEFLGRIESLLDGADGFYEQVFASLGVILPALERRAGRSDAVTAPRSRPRPPPRVRPIASCSARCRRRRRSSRRTGPTAISVPTSTRSAHRRSAIRRWTRRPTA